MRGFPFVATGFASCGEFLPRCNATMTTVLFSFEQIYIYIYIARTLCFTLKGMLFSSESCDSSASYYFWDVRGIMCRLRFVVTQYKFPWHRSVRPTPVSCCSRSAQPSSCAFSHLGAEVGADQQISNRGLLTMSYTS